MGAVLRAISLAVLVAAASGAGRTSTAHAAPCRRGLL